MNAPALQAHLARERAHASAAFRLDEELGTHHGISWSDFVLLDALAEAAGAVREPELASRLGVRRSSLLLRLRPLEKIGLVTRMPGAGGHAVGLTPAARRLHREAGETAGAVCASVRDPGASPG